MKPKDKKIDESKWAVATWRIVKKWLLHNSPSEYCNGKVYSHEEEKA